MSIISGFKKRTSVDSIVAVFNEMVENLRNHAENLDAESALLRGQLFQVSTEKQRAEDIINKLKGIVK